MSEKPFMEINMKELSPLVREFIRLCDWEKDVLAIPYCVNGGRRYFVSFEDEDGKSAHLPYMGGLPSVDFAYANDITVKNINKITEQNIAEWINRYLTESQSLKDAKILPDYFKELVRLAVESGNLNLETIESPLAYILLSMYVDEKREKTNG